MAEFRDRYLNPFTDFGFKKLFGVEVNKNLLMDFLNELLRDEQGEIKQLTYLRSEMLGSSDLERRAIFDLYCENERGEKFIVELQKTKQKFFKDRTLYYSTFPIREQAQRANWNFELKAIYCIAILDFVFDDDKNDNQKYRYKVKFMDVDRLKVFYDKLTFIYLEMPKFNKTIDELETRFEKWMYVIKNLNRLDNLPERLRERVFEQLFEAAEIARFTPDQSEEYEGSLKVFRDLNNTMETAIEEATNSGMSLGIAQGIELGLVQGIEKGIEKGIEREARNIAVKCLRKGMLVDEIVEITELPVDLIEQIREEISRN